MGESTPAKPPVNKLTQAAQDDDATKPQLGKHDQGDRKQNLIEQITELPKQKLRALFDAGKISADEFERRMKHLVEETDVSVD
ncbi:hypothetical protein A3A79_05460 [Candidatus Gottesmanbacteria bacterium RIFCSPLOWO2_01_FULL_43_11b]|uniref:Uncharacterized protein n=1 Tax=Candidatus Gottesmanbacteria bacterium RIFCSPLOWO2_01_FULL_43_11b TaxID=1798392 RepID=A0A1F6AIS2_9BACT|nr:MAG: hypothetical protein A3A79_05460 [Candidatus Gottesmanbacteria bacterium RIFCSPLOWO2_01_FULL_43_11b]